jgi:hypothetical protein
MTLMDNIPIFGAAALGCIIGWLVYYINRYRKADVQFGDLTTVIGIIGGAGVTSIFGGADKSLFGAYGIGLFVGFFGYFLVLVALVRSSKGVFNATWFLDGRRKKPLPDEEIQGVSEPGNRVMDFQPTLNERIAVMENRQQSLEEAVSVTQRVNRRNEP